MERSGYLRNLFIALLGKNPFLIEYNKVQEEYDLTAKRVGELEESLAQRTERLAEAWKDAGALRGQVSDLQRLVENLRQRLAETKEDLDYAVERAREAQRMMADNVVAQADLQKLNNALDDLCQAMQSRDAGKMRMAADYMEWNERLRQIAQIYLGVITA